MADSISLEIFVVDTGAKFSCCSAQIINLSLKEEQFKDSEVKYIGGFVKDKAIKFYRYPLKQFTVGNIDLKKQDLWITFDRRITDTILGMDILKQIILITNPYNQQIYFCKDIDDYNRNFHW